MYNYGSLRYNTHPIQFLLVNNIAAANQPDPINLSVDKLITDCQFDDDIQLINNTNHDMKLRRFSLKVIKYNSFMIKMQQSSKI
jgi:hypothetical protein